MSDHGTHHHHEADHSTEPKSKTSFRASFWLVVILVGLFVGAVNFVGVMGHDGGHEATTAAHGAGHEAGGHEAAGSHEAPAPQGTTQDNHDGGHADVHTFGTSDQPRTDSAHHE